MSEGDAAGRSRLRRGEDRLVCPECHTHNPTTAAVCVNCRCELGDADRIPFIPAPTTDP